MSRLPLRATWKAMRRPSGAKFGENSLVGALVSRIGSPPRVRTLKRSKLPARSESYAIHSPDGSASKFSMISFASVMRYAPTLERAPGAGIGSDQMLLRFVYREKAIRRPLRARSIVCAPSPVVSRTAAPPASPSSVMAMP